MSVISRTGSMRSASSTSFPFTDMLLNWCVKICFDVLRPSALLCSQVHALAEFHSLGYTHFDIKPTNVLISPAGHLAIADFGLAKKLVRGQATGWIGGTTGYEAPEVISPNLFDITQKADVWNLGLVILESFLLHDRGSPYYQRARHEGRKFKIEDNDPEFFRMLTRKETLEVDPRSLLEMVYVRTRDPRLYDLLSKVRRPHFPGNTY